MTSRFPLPRVSRTLGGSAERSATSQPESGDTRTTPATVTDGPARGQGDADGATGVGRGQLDDGRPEQRAAFGVLPKVRLDQAPDHRREPVRLLVGVHDVHGASRTLEAARESNSS